MAERQKQEFELQIRHPVRFCGYSSQHGRTIVADAGENLSYFLPVLPPPKVEKRRAAQFALKKTAGAAAGYAHGKAEWPIDRKNKRVSQNAADRAWIDFVALGSASRAPQLYPVCVQFLTGCEFHEIPLCVKTLRFARIACAASD